MESARNEPAVMHPIAGLPVRRVDAAIPDAGGLRTGVKRRAFGQLASVVIGIAVITGYVEFRSRIVAYLQSAPSASVTPDPAAEPIAAEPDAAASDIESRETVEESPPPPAAPARAPAPAVVDRAAVSAAEAALDAASRDRARADHRTAESARQLALASGQAALDAARARKLAFLVRDPSTRIAVLSARGGFLRGERDKLSKDVTTLRQLPRPKSKSILSKSPVARPATDDECHFELKRNRVSFINLDRLIELTMADARLRIRMADHASTISNKVGPVGAFSITYELDRATPGSMDELLGRRGTRFELRGWELIPESESRGETYEATRNPISEYSRALNRVSPARAAITLWVYPDSFMLFRRLRDDLVERGFSVAARPLPGGMTIRGSPMGTQSAAQ
jgi:hypothetical protein